MKIKKGDTVLIISGKDRGKKGKVLEVFPKEERILVEGANLRKKHIKPRRAGEKGQVAEMSAPIHISNIKLICSKCGKPTRIGYKMISKIKNRASIYGSEGEEENEVLFAHQKSKIRICKKCGQEI